MYVFIRRKSPPGDPGSVPFWAADEAAIHDEGVSVDIRGVVAGEIEGGVCNVFGLTRTVDGLSASESFGHEFVCFVGFFGREVQCRGKYGGGDTTGADTVDADVVRSQFHCRCAGEVYDGGFARAVHMRPIARAKARDRTRADDAAGSLFFHDGSRVFDAHEDAALENAYGFVKPPHGCFFNRSRDTAVSGVVKEAI